MALGTGLIAAAALTAAGAPADPAPPVRISCLVADGRLRVEIVGSSASSFEADYALEVRSGVVPGQNRAVNRGHVRLTPGRPVTLATVVTSAPPGGRWAANLEVTPATGPAYRQSEEGAVP